MRLDKIKQRLWVAALASGIAATAGCARKAETPVQTTVAAESSAAVPAAADGTAAAGTETETAGQPESMTTAPKPIGAEVNGDTVNIINGVVTDAAADTVTITTGKYPEGITFLKANAAGGLGEELAAGQEITIFYRGDIKDGETSGVTAELLRDKRDGDEEAQAAMATGKIISIGMSVITIETADGKNISFEQDPKPVNTTEGPIEGDQVTMIYSYQDEAREGAVMLELIRKAE